MKVQEVLSGHNRRPLWKALKTLKLMCVCHEQKLSEDSHRRFRKPCKKLEVVVVFHKTSQSVRLGDTRELERVVNRGRLETRAGHGVVPSVNVGILMNVKRSPKRV